ncbi:MAG: CooT family nickel-binding protein [Clostridiales bacterium]|jgi:predicted RNA-binding protein|nr:CooT family nickel-binding protein [Clostridiales bacterium]
MCEATVYFEDDEGLKLYFDNVDKIFPGEDQLILEDIFGQKKIIKARLKELHLVDHKIIIERTK